MPIDRSGQIFFVKKAVFMGRKNGRLHQNVLKIKSSWCEAEKANGAIDRSILFAVQVRLIRLGVVAMLQLLMMVVKQVVQFFQGHYLKNQQRQ